MTPSVTRTIDETRSTAAAAKTAGRTVGLVPTMGALHAGHASLIRAARNEAGFVVVTIFVNPTQFGPNEDLERYPRTFEKDLHLCAAEGTDLVFAPTPAVMYPPGYRTHVEVHGLQEVLCGVTRPTHFRGVATVVLKLFNIIQPDVAYFGQKDAQQARLLQKMVEDLNVPVRMRVLPTVREPDGLALSSRNQYLNPDQRRNATALFHALEQARALVEGGERDARVIEGALRRRIEAAPGARLDYAAVIDYESLQPAGRLSGKALVALAVYFGDTRLIDNLLLDVAEERRS
jgi:pantoate--beta-alanine ligase